MPKKTTKPSSRSLTILLAHVRGLRPFLEQELKIQGLPAPYRYEMLRNEDMAFIKLSPAEIAQARGLRSIEGSFVVISGERELNKREQLTKLFPPGIKDWILQSLVHLEDQKPARSYALFVKAREDSPVFRREIVAQFAQWMRGAFPRWRYTDPAPLEFWGLHLEGKFTLALRLTKKARVREYRTGERAGSLKPSVAAALALEVESPGEGFCILDPMCGSGTLLFEHAILHDAPVSYFGWDIDSDAIALAERNAASFTTSVDQANFTFCCTDALKPARSAINALSAFTQIVVLCNLPFGKQFETETPISEFYELLLDTLCSHLPHLSQFVLLCSDQRSLSKALKKRRLAHEVKGPIFLRGLRVYVFTADVD
jgi:predicted RNA methylase